MSKIFKSSLPYKNNIADQSLIHLMAIGSESISIVQNIFEESTHYFTSITGKPASSTEASKFFETLPSDCSQGQKKTYKITLDSDDIGVVDLLTDYPQTGTAYLGLLLVKETFKNQGIGRQVLQKLEQTLSKDLSCNKIRIAVISSNDVIGFWEKMGFKQTGKSSSFEFDAFKSKNIILEKSLN